VHGLGHELSDGLDNKCPNPVAKQKIKNNMNKTHLITAAFIAGGLLLGVAIAGYRAATTTTTA
jgi:hypothetical protein